MKRLLSESFGENEDLFFLAPYSDINPGPQSSARFAPRNFQNSGLWLTVRFPSWRTVRNFRTVDSGCNSPDEKMDLICSLILALLDKNSSTICACVSHHTTGHFQKKAEKALTSSLQKHEERCFLHTCANLVNCTQNMALGL